MSHLAAADWPNNSLMSCHTKQMISVLQHQDYLTCIFDYQRSPPGPKSRLCPLVTMVICMLIAYGEDVRSEITRCRIQIHAARLVGFV